ncbi:MAG: archease [Candidatus Nanoarchaeia archaeon]
MEKFRILENNEDNEENNQKFLAFGKTQEEAFENSALGIIDIICKHKVRDALITKVKISGEDYETLLYNFLNEILNLAYSQNFLLNKINRISKITLDKNQEYWFVAELSGDDAREYNFETKINKIIFEEIFVKSPRGDANKKFNFLKANSKTPSFSAHEKQKWTTQVCFEI